MSDLPLSLVLQLIFWFITRRLMASIKETIKAANDIRSEVIEIPEWGQVKIEVRSMSAKARARLLKAAATDDGQVDLEKLYPSILVACCYDPDSGEPIFTPGDEAFLSEKSAGPVEKLAGAGMRLSGLTEEAVEEGKDAS